MVKERCKDTKRQNILAEMSEKSSLALHPEMNFCWGKRVLLEERKKRNSVVASRVVKVERTQQKYKAICPLRLGEKDIKHMLLACLETKNWRIQFLNEILLNMNKQIDYRKILCTTNDLIRNLGTYLGKVKYKWFNKTKEV
jgi:hypothetical protein